jgi:hypothetical protein
MEARDVVLGSKYKDEITGYQGTAIAETRWLNGCVRFLLQRANKDGKPEDEWFDVQQLSPFGRPKKTKKPKLTGGPRPNPQRQKDPSR